MNKKYKVSRPLIPKRHQEKMKKAEDFSGIIPDPRAQILSKGLKGTRIVGDNIREVSDYTRVDGHWRTMHNGRKVFIKPHSRRVGREYRLKR